MKKIFAIAIFGVLAVSCSKKESTFEQDSNVMLEEPKVEMVDSAAVTKPVDQTTVATPETAVKVDSVTTQ